MSKKITAQSYLDGDLKKISRRLENDQDFVTELESLIKVDRSYQKIDFEDLDEDFDLKIQQNAIRFLRSKKSLKEKNKRGSSLNLELITVMILLGILSFNNIKISEIDISETLVLASHYSELEDESLLEVASIYYGGGQ